MAKRKRVSSSQAHLFDLDVPTTTHTRPHEQGGTAIEASGPACNLAKVSRLREDVLNGGRPKVPFSVSSCPVCGSRVNNDPDGRRRCSKCWWWQGVAE